MKPQRVKKRKHPKTGVTRSLTPAQRKQARSTQKGCAVLHHNDDVTIYVTTFERDINQNTTNQKIITI